MGLGLELNTPNSPETLLTLCPESVDILEHNVFSTFPVASRSVTERPKLDCWMTPYLWSEMTVEKGDVPASAGKL